MLDNCFHFSSNSSLGTPVGVLWHSSLRKHLMLAMLASTLSSSFAGILCHPVKGAVKWQILKSTNAKARYQMCPSLVGHLMAEITFPAGYHKSQVFDGFCLKRSVLYRVDRWNAKSRLAHEFLHQQAAV